MSYDLYFLRPREKGPLAADEVFRYFDQRAHYHVKREAAQAVYANEQTGVYFTFDTGPQVGPDEDEDLSEEEALHDGWIDAEVSFNLNYYRPHVFGLEAEAELTAFVAHFQLAVQDLQIDGMGRGPFSAEGFLKAWNAGNFIGYRAVFGQGEPPNAPLAILPSAEILRIWRWNHRSTSLQAELGEEVFVPRIMCWHLDGRVVTFATWTDAIPMALPRVDFIVFVRVDLAKRRWLGLLPGKPELVGTRWDELSAFVHEAERKEDPRTDGYHFFRDAELLKKVEGFVRSREPGLPDMMPLSMDALLNQELVTAAKQAKLGE